MKRLADELIGDVRTVEITGVDVIDPARYSLAQHGERPRAIFWWAEHAGSCELHCAVAHAVHGVLSEREHTSIRDVGHIGSPALTSLDGAR
jgi:hypothetical protein